MKTGWTYPEYRDSPAIADMISMRLGPVERVGMTGSSEPVSSRQLVAAYRLLVAIRARVPHVQPEHHHGDCVEADEAVAVLAEAAGFRVVGHPSDDAKQRAFFPSAESWPEKPYMDRNTDIARAGQVLVALPPTDVEVVRSGTWATVRRGRKAGVPVVLFTPTSIRMEHPDAAPGAVTLW